MARTTERDDYFTCLLPPESIRRRFNAVAAAAPAGADVKRAEDLHITLNYLRRPRSRPKRELVERLSRIEFPAFDLTLKDMESFYRIPRKDMNSHVIWMRPDAAGGWKIRDLHARIHLSLRPVGFNVGEASMTPHMTALKFPFSAHAAPLEKFIADHAKLRMPKWHVDRFYLCRTLPRTHADHPDNNSGRGSKYQIVAEFPLAPARDLSL
jgi:2'-5' RNA ligase